MSVKIIKHFKASDPILHEVFIKVHKEYGDKVFALKKSGDPFVDLCESIISQQLSVKASDTIFQRILKLMPGSKLNPENVLKTKDEKLRSAGLSYSKIKYLKDLSQKVKNKELDLNILHRLTNEEVIEQLTKVKGIGKWTAEMFLMFGLGREDIFSHGDLGLKNAIKKLYKLEVYEEKTVEEIIIKWSPYKTYACRILWRSLTLS